MIRVVLAFALLLPLGAQAQRQINTWQDLGGYVGEQTTKLNELQAKLRFQQGLIDAQAARIEALKAHTEGQRAYLIDFICKWNRLLEQLAAATGPNPAVGPPVTKACDMTSPAPEWPAAIE
jgi:hypothetical protein